MVYNRYDVGTLTKMLLTIGVDPAQKLNYIPQYYLYGSDIDNYIIPPKVETIQDLAFCACGNLIHIDIPQNVKEIGASAFSNCKKLQSVKIKEGLTSIGGSAFQNCGSLKSIKLPSTIQNIGIWAFYNCTSLIELEIPNTIANIGNTEIFKDCLSLKEIIYKGTKEEAFKCGLMKKKWRKGSPIEKIICTNGVIKL